MSDHHNDPSSPTTTPQPPPPSSAFERFRQAVLSVAGLDGDENPDRRAQKELKTRQRNEEIRLECERIKTDLLATSPLLVFMQKHLNLAGNPVPASNIQCGTCGNARAGGFSPDLGGIFLCSDQMFSKSHMETTIAHELLHLYDHTTFKMDWSNLRHHACSEIRANSLSGDCRFWREITRGSIHISKHHQACVRRRAITSVAANPNCKDRETAEKVVNEVFDSCFKDTRPFDEIY